MHSGVHSVEIVLLLLLTFVTVFGLLARKLDTPYPIVLVVAGLGLGFVPGMPRFTLDPDVVFLAVLPPLLYSAAWQTSWREFRYNLFSIGLLAFGLVTFLVVAVAALLPRLLPEFDWRTAFVLGAVVAPTDAIAASSIARRVGLPQRVVDVLEGESLINDATGLLALEFGTAMVVAGKEPALGEGLLRLAWLITGGVSAGLLIGVFIDWLERKIDDGPIEITLSLLVPYATYLAAESVQSSGVLAVVACGLWLSRRSAEFFSPQVRIQAWAVWEALEFALNGLVFVLIGLQLPEVLERLRGYSPSQLLVSALWFTLLLIVLRLVWIFPGANLAYLGRRYLQHQQEPRPPAKSIFVVGWTGMRGVVALAAALALPVQRADGSPFPQRDLILYLTFAAILVTLVGQGLTLPILIRKLGLAGVAGPNCEELEARQILLQAALQHIEEAKQRDSSRQQWVYEDLAEHYRQNLAAVQAKDGKADAEPEHSKHQQITQEILQMQRRTAISLRDEGRINDNLLRILVRELDLSETRLHEPQG